MIIAGIDPGLTGALAVIDTDEGTATVADLPTIEWGNGAVKRALDLPALAVMLAKIMPDRVVVERVHSMPLQGVASMFSLGMTFGGILGVVAGLELPVMVVSPRDWKGALGLTADKDTARGVAAIWYPLAAGMLGRKRDHNRAEALLLAHFGRHA